MDMSACRFPATSPRRWSVKSCTGLPAPCATASASSPKSIKPDAYGFGAATAGLLEDEGFLVDTSLIPRTRYTESGGPDFAAFDYGPFWFGARRRLLELPVTRALTGMLAGALPGLYGLAERKPLRSLRAPGLLARARLLERITLSPEGSDLAAMQRLTRALLRRGERVFTLSYHSPSLEPGNTPYVRDRRDLAIFLDRLSGYLSFFRDEIGGVFLTVKQLHAQLQSGALANDHSRAQPRAPRDGRGGEPLPGCREYVSADARRVGDRL